jgi:creatinine amidohydrolase/Fe(II)-dependent formamide hydrolase-like protein
MSHQDQNVNILPHNTQKKLIQDLIPFIVEIENQKYSKENYSIKLYSIGAHYENHGKALPFNIDDYIARHLATRLSEEICCDYIGHLPYCGDREGNNAKDWNPGVMEKEVVINGIISDIKNDLSKRKNLGLSPSTCIVIVSGHGGNNFLVEEQEKIGRLINMPFLYLPPFDKISIKHRKFGKLEITHADHAEHSVADFLGLLDKEELQKINNLAKKDPIRALKENPAIMGLGGYVLPEIGGEKYQSLRVRHPELVKMAKKFIRSDKKIIVDKKVGELLIKRAIIMAKKRIRSFTMVNYLYKSKL